MKRIANMLGVLAVLLLLVLPLAVSAEEVCNHNNTWVDIPAKNATCTEPGTINGVWCSVCHFILNPPTETAPAAGHDWAEEFTVDQEPTCTEAGSKSIHCSRCDEVKDTETIPAPGHTGETVPGKEPTCTETGLTDGSKCAVCGTLLKEQETIDMLPHTPGQKHDEKPANHFSAGNIEYYDCTGVGTGCDKKLDADGNELSDIVIPKREDDVDWNFRWEGNCVVWDPVEGADHYSARVFRTGSGVFGNPKVNGTSTDITEYFEKHWGPGTYYIKVTAYSGREYITSPKSPEKVYAAPVVDLGEPTNAVWDGTVARWDAAEYAEYYILTLYKEGRKFCVDYYDVEETECDLSEELEFFGSGTYHFEVQSYRAKNYKGPAVSGTLEYTAENDIPKVQNPHWDGYVAKWDPVENAKGYDIVIAICQDSISYLSADPSVNFYDFSDEVVKYGCGQFSFEVAVYLDDGNGGWSHGGWSDTSDTLVYHKSIKDLPRVEPTCTSTGLTAGSKCNACHEVVQKQEVIDKLPHTLGQKHDEKPATYVTEGTVAYYDCTGCDAKLDANGKELADIVIPAREVDWNLRWDGNCVVWDPVEGADFYSVDLFMVGAGFYGDPDVNGTSTDITEYVEEYWGPGTYYVRVTAYFKDGYIESPKSPEKVYAPPVVDLGEPTNAVWEGTKARWDAAEHAEYYILTLYQVGRKNPIGPFEVEGAECDFSWELERYGSGTYYFEVQSYRAKNYRGPAVSGTLEYTAEKEFPKVQNPHWEGYVATWDPVENARGYNISITICGDTISYFGSDPWENSYDFSDKLVNYGCGQYSFEVAVYLDNGNGGRSHGGRSDTSDTLVYHKSVKQLPKVEPTCTSTGLTAGSKCAACQDVLQKREIIPATGKHTYTDQVIAEPTCTKPGTRIDTCSVCGDTHEEPIPALGHSYTDKVTTKPTCTETGTRTYTCSACGDTYEEPIAARGHNYTKKVTEEPTCTETGTRTYTCLACRDTYTESIAALGHDRIEDVTKEPTCTEAGEQNVTCSRCDFSAVEAVDALGHKEQRSIVTKATLTTDGEAFYTCTACGEERTEVIPAVRTIKLSEVTYTYDGKAKKPTVTVEDSAGKTLAEGTDYSVSYAGGRTNVGSYTVTVTGMGSYSFTKELSFKVTAAGIKSASLSAASYTYNGKVRNPAVTVKDASGKTLVKGTDYTVTYSKGCKDVGSYTVTVKGKGNYSFTKTLTFKINPVKTAIAKLTAGKKAFTVKWKKKTAQVTGYEIQYSLKKNFASGNKTVAVKGASTVSKTIKKLKAGKTYYVRVRTYKTVSGTQVYSDWSAAKSIKTKK